MIKNLFAPFSSRRTSATFLLLLIFSPVVYSVLFSAISSAGLEGPVLLFYFICIPAFLAAKKRWAERVPHRLAIPLFLFCAYGFLLIVRSAIPSESLLSMLRTSGFFLLFWASATFLNTPRLKRAALGTLLTLAISLSLYEITKEATGTKSIFWIHYPHDKQLAATYACRNHFAYFLEVMTPFCIGLTFFYKKKRLVRMLAMAGLVIFPVTLILTGSRSGVIGAILAVGVTGLAFIWSRKKSYFRKACWLAPLLASVLFAGICFFSTPFTRTIDQFKAFTSEGKAYRLSLALDTVDLIRTQPWFGYGPGTFFDTYPRFRARISVLNTLYFHPHNEYLECLAEFGAIGGLLAVWVIGAVFSILFSRIRNPRSDEEFLYAIAFLGAFTGTLFHSFFDFQLRVIPNALILAVLAGISLSGSSGRNPVRKAAARHSLILSVLVVLSLASLAPLSSTVMGSLGMYWYLNFGQLLVAEKFYKAAVIVDPGNWRAFLGLGSLYSQYSRYVEGEARRIFVKESLYYLRESLRLNPWDSVTRTEMGQILVLNGEAEEGLRIFRELVKVEPMISGTWCAYGLAADRSGHYAEASLACVQACRMHPSFSGRKTMYTTSLKASEKAEFAYNTLLLRKAISAQVPRSDILPAQILYWRNTAQEDPSSSVFPFQYSMGGH